MTQDKIIDRDQLQDSMINQILDDMDIKTMMAILYDNMSESYDKYSVDELIAEVEEYYPHLLEERSINQLTRWHTTAEIPQIHADDTIMNKTTDMIPTEQQAQWNDIMGQMCAYVDDKNADIDMAAQGLGVRCSTFLPLLITSLHGIHSTKLGNLATIAMIYRFQKGSS